MELRDWLLGGLIVILIAMVVLAVRVYYKRQATKEAEVKTAVAAVLADRQKAKSEPDYDEVMRALRVASKIMKVQVPWSDYRLFMYKDELHTVHDLVMAFVRLEGSEDWYSDMWNSVKNQNARDDLKVSSRLGRIVVRENRPTFDELGVGRTLAEMDVGLISRPPIWMTKLANVDEVFSYLEKWRNFHMPAVNTLEIPLKDIVFIYTDGMFYPLIKEYHDDSWVDCGHGGPIIYARGEKVHSTMLSDPTRYTSADTIDKAFLARVLDTFEFSQELVEIEAKLPQRSDDGLLDIKIELSRQLHEFGIYDLENRPSWMDDCPQP